MWIVAVAWIYVVGLMALTEPSAVAGIMTFFGYCVLPLSILHYLTGSRRRRHKADAARADSWRRGRKADATQVVDLPAVDTGCVVNPADGGTGGCDDGGAC